MALTTVKKINNHFDDIIIKVLSRGYSKIRNYIQEWKP